MTDEEFQQKKKIIEDSFAKAGELYRKASPEQKTEYRKILSEMLATAISPRNL